MKDLNFFSSYGKRREKSLSKDYILYGFAIISLIVMIGYSIFNYVGIKKLNAEVAILSKQVQEKKQNVAIKEIIEKEEEIDAFKESINKLKALDDYADSRDLINEYLLGEVENGLPSKIFLKSMVLSSRSIKIEGKSQDKESIAQFQHNLDKLEAFEQVFVPRISYDENHYSFSMDITFKEEEDNGTDGEKQ